MTPSDRTFKPANHCEEAYPKRYRIDRTGKRVLIGLSAKETREFEQVADRPSTGIDEDRERKRWFALYAKHEQSWRRRIAVTAREQKQ